MRVFKWYRKLKGGIWYKHEFTNDALDLCCTFIGSFWSRYDELNRYSTVIDIEEWQ